MHKWREGDTYHAKGPGLWRVERVSAMSATIFADDYTKTRSARGTVVLCNDDLEWEIIAPLDSPDLQHLERADDTPAWKD